MRDAVWMRPERRLAALLPFQLVLRIFPVTWKRGADHKFLLRHRATSLAEHGDRLALNEPSSVLLLWRLNRGTVLGKCILTGRHCGWQAHCADFFVVVIAGTASHH